MTYVAGSGRWSVTGATALSDSGATTGTAPNTITSTYTGRQQYVCRDRGASAGGAIRHGDLPGQRRRRHRRRRAEQTRRTYSYNNGAGTTVSGSSNTVPFTVRQGAGVTLTGQTGGRAGRTRRHGELYQHPHPTAATPLTLQYHHRDQHLPAARLSAVQERRCHPVDRHQRRTARRTPDRWPPPPLTT